MMKKAISLNMSLGDIVSQYPQTRELLETLGLDYCCGGRQALSDAAAASGRDPNEVLSRLIKTAEAPAETKQIDFTALSLTELVSHIEQTHHVFMRQQLPRLSDLLRKVKQAHGRQYGDMLTALEQVFQLLNADISMHLEKEELVLFPYIRQIEAYMQDAGPAPEMHCGTVQNPIHQMEHEHDLAGDALLRMRKLTDNYQVPPDGCASFRALYEGLNALEADLHHHIHLENNILFPRAVQMEETMARKQHA